MLHTAQLCLYSFQIRYMNWEIILTLNAYQDTKLFTVKQHVDICYLGYFVENTDSQQILNRQVSLTI